ncbi:hypothetical protein ACFXG4_14070 [Nocardia sp. NPDC059246]|uniref:hypothetical protein n=1 Tax=unclassified Nocardia TaxID=2637762 RepID=UPI0036CC0496
MTATSQYAVADGPVAGVGAIPAQVSLAWLLHRSPGDDYVMVSVSRQMWRWGSGNQSGSRTTCFTSKGQ